MTVVASHLVETPVVTATLLDSLLTYVTSIPGSIANRVHVIPALRPEPYINPASPSSNPHQTLLPLPTIASSHPLNPFEFSMSSDPRFVVTTPPPPRNVSSLTFAFDSPTAKRLATSRALSERWSRRSAV